MSAGAAASNVVALQPSGDVVDFKHSRTGLQSLLTLFKPAAWLDCVADPESDNGAFLHFFGSKKADGPPGDYPSMPSFDTDAASVGTGEATAAYYGNVYVVRTQGSTKPVRFSQIKELTASQYIDSSLSWQADHDDGGSESGSGEDEPEPEPEPEPEQEPEQEPEGGSAAVASLAKTAPRPRKKAEWEGVPPITSGDGPVEGARVEFLSWLDTHFTSGWTNELEAAIFERVWQKAVDETQYPSWKNPAFHASYTSRARHIGWNLLNGVADQLDECTLTVGEVASSTPADLAPEIWRPLLEGRLAREKQGQDLVLASAKDVFCGRCKKVSPCTVWEKQTRSGDEGMTTFFNCLACSKTWHS